MRLNTVTIPVPNRSKRVWQAIMVRNVKASRPHDSPVHKRMETQRVSLLGDGNQIGI